MTLLKASLSEGSSYIIREYYTFTDFKNRIFFEDKYYFDPVASEPK